MDRRKEKRPRPNSATERLLELAYILQEEGRPEKAQEYYRVILKKEPDNAAAWKNLAGLKMKEGKGRTAILLAKIGIARDERSQSSALRNLGNYYYQLEKYEEAILTLKDAIKEEPDHWSGHYQMGVIAQSTGHNDAALEHMRRAFELAPKEEKPNISVGMGYALLGLGKIKEGLTLVRPQWEISNTWVGDLGIPKLEGPHQSVKGRTILVYHNQGYGDSVQFSRYLPDLQEKGARAILAVQQPLVNFFTETISMVDVVDIEDYEKMQADYYVPLVLLPLVLGTEETKGAPYLGTRGTEFGRSPGDSLRVGLIWEAERSHNKGAIRSVPFAELMELAYSRELDLYGLQTNPGAMDIHEEGMEVLIKDWSPHIADFRDLANLMETMDVIVSADTAPLHLAGAMGLPTIGMMSYGGADWRWRSRGISTTPWYDTVKLIWQTGPGEWRDVIRRTRRELERFRREGVW